MARSIRQPTKSRGVFTLFRIIFFFLIGLGAAYFPGILKQQITALDDGYMYVRYAQHLLDGYGIAWNPDPTQTYGVTSIPFLLCVTALKAFLNLPPAYLLQILSWAFAALGLFLTIECIISSAETRLFKDVTVTGTLVLAPLLFSETFQGAMFNGMDTSLALCANAFALYCALFFTKEQNAPRTLLAAFAAYLTYSVRPENLIGALLIVPLFCWVAPQVVRRMYSTILYLSFFAIFLSIDVSVKTFWFGLPLPLPLFAKYAGFLTGYTDAARWNPIEYLGMFLTVSLPFLCIGALTIGNLPKRFLYPYVVPTIVFSIAFFGIIQIMGLSARFYMPMLPLLIVGSLLAADKVLEQKQGFPLSRFGVLAALSCIVGVYFLRYEGSHFWEKKILRIDRSYAERLKSLDSVVPVYPEYSWEDSTRAVRTLLSGLDSTLSIAATEHGYIGAEDPQRTIIDLSGLHNPRIFKEGFSVHIIMDERPDMVVLPVPDYTYLRWRLFTSPDFFKLYMVYPNIFNWGIAVREDSPFFFELSQRLEKLVIEDTGIALARQELTAPLTSDEAFK